MNQKGVSSVRLWTSLMSNRSSMKKKIRTESVLADIYRFEGIEKRIFRKKLMDKLIKNEKNFVLDSK